MICHEHDCAAEIERLKAETEKLGRGLLLWARSAVDALDILRGAIDHERWPEAPTLTAAAELASQEIGDRGQRASEAETRLERALAEIERLKAEAEQAEREGSNLACHEPELDGTMLACPAYWRGAAHGAAVIQQLQARVDRYEATLAAVTRERDEARAEIAAALREIPIEARRATGAPVVLRDEVAAVVREWARVDREVDEVCAERDDLRARLAAASRIAASIPAAPRTGCDCLTVCECREASPLPSAAPAVEPGATVVTSDSAPAAAGDAAGSRRGRAIPAPGKPGSFILPRLP